MSSLSVQASASALPPLPKNQTVLGCGGLGMDILAAVDSYPNPDDKIRSTSLKVQGGGNAGNVLTCVARLGLNARLISKVSKEGNSPFTYIIVDNEMRTRTCIHTPGSPPIILDDLSKSSLSSPLNGIQLFYSDVRLHKTALVIAQEAKRLGIPMLINAEKKREGLDDLLKFTDYSMLFAQPNFHRQDDTCL